VSSIFHEAVFGNRELVVEFTPAGDVVLHDPTGELDLGVEFAAVELGFAPPPWLAAFENRLKNPAWYLMQQKLLVGPALKLWCLAMVERATQIADVNLDGGIMERARAAALLPPGQAARTVARVRKEIRRRWLDGRELSAMMFDAVGFWADIADREWWNDDELYNLVYQRMTRGLATAVALNYRGRAAKKEIDALREWMVAEAVRQINAQEEL